MQGYHIHIEGQVQGIGFRPYVFNLANQLSLVGQVNNDSDGIHIYIGGHDDDCRSFIDSLTNQPTPLAHITRHTIQRAEILQTENFVIAESNNHPKVNLLVTPDLGLCEDCRKEIQEAGRRNGYAFTTCTHCGPRYSIIESLPYDRAHTTMGEFVMCKDCQHEYALPTDRRYYSQTNSCPHCGITLSLLDHRGSKLSMEGDEILNQVTSFFQQGKILAVKGIGGFLLMCDATNGDTVTQLRQRKQRPTKPLAVLYPSLTMAGQDLVISRYEQKELTSIISPIVLLGLKEERFSGIAIDEVAPGLSKVGAMLPYTPLLERIAQAWGKPLVATSGNISGSPIFYEDHQAVAHLQTIADFILTYNRRIVVPQDDSVVQFAGNRKIILRRSRGLAPTYTPSPFKEVTETVFATGSDMKSAFALQLSRDVHVSQYLGDLENFEAFQSYKTVVHHFKKLFKFHPKRVLTDRHPSYFSSSIGKDLAASWRVPIQEIQHHLAHFSAVLAENDLLSTQVPVLGVVWDGTGWGDDGNLWGSEFFCYEANQFSRVVHLDYVKNISGDKMAREPRISALSFFGNLPEGQELLQSKFTPQEWKIYQHTLTQSQGIETSSMGRLFDAVASLLGLCDVASYEGEAALLLEACAARLSSREALREAETPVPLKYFLKHLCNDIRKGTAQEVLAYRFHVSLVSWIEAVAQENKVFSLAFSGGVFQNALLIELIQRHQGSRFNLFFHQQLSCNDECIGFGQLAYHYIQTTKKVNVRRNTVTTI